MVMVSPRVGYPQHVATPSDPVRQIIDTGLINLSQSIARTLNITWTVSDVDNLVNLIGSRPIVTPEYETAARAAHWPLCDYRDSDNHPTFTQWLADAREWRFIDGPAPAHLTMNEMIDLIRAENQTILNAAITYGIDLLALPAVDRCHLTAVEAVTEDVLTELTGWPLADARWVLDTIVR